MKAISTAAHVEMDRTPGSTQSQGRRALPTGLAGEVQKLGVPVPHRRRAARNGPVQTLSTRDGPRRRNASRRSRRRGGRRPDRSALDRQDDLDVVQGAGRAVDLDPVCLQPRRQSVERRRVRRLPAEEAEDLRLRRPPRPGAACARPSERPGPRRRGRPAACRANGSRTNPSHQAARIGCRCSRARSVPHAASCRSLS